MSNPLDEIAFKLGELSAGNAMLLKRAEKRDAQMDAFGTQLNTIGLTLTPLVDDVKKMKPDVAHYRSVRRNVVWAGSAVWAFALFAGTMLVDWLKKKYSS